MTFDEWWNDYEKSWNYKQHSDRDIAAAAWYVAEEENQKEREDSTSGMKGV